MIGKSLLVMILGSINHVTRLAAGLPRVSEKRTTPRHIFLYQEQTFELQRLPQNGATQFLVGAAEKKERKRRCTNIGKRGEPLVYQMGTIPTTNQKHCFTSGPWLEAIFDGQPWHAHRLVALQARGSTNCFSAPRSLFLGRVESAGKAAGRFRLYRRVTRALTHAIAVI